MAFTHQITANGALLRTTTSGKIQGECCCGGNPCGSTGCTVSGVGAQCPSIELTVFDADYAGGDITWCGVTWTQAEVQAGATKTGCPTAYKKKKYTTYTYISPSLYYRKFNAIHYWRYNVELTLRRGVVKRTANGTGTLSNRRRNKLTILGSLTDNYYWFDAAGLVSSTCELNKICALGEPTYSNYNITSGFFGSHTVGGIQYSWNEGEDW